MNDWRNEELSYPRALGSYVQQLSPEGRCIILIGKYKGSFLDTVPKGYVRSFILKKWELTPLEQKLFEVYAVRTEAEEKEHQEKEERKRLRAVAREEKRRIKEEKAQARAIKKGLAYGNPTA